MGVYDDSDVMPTDILNTGPARGFLTRRGPGEEVVHSYTKRNRKQMLVILCRTWNIIFS